MAQDAGVRPSFLKRAALKVGGLMAQYGGGITLTLNDERLGQLLGGSQSASTGHIINDDSAMRVTTAFACVRILAETVGAVTLAVFEKQSNGNMVKVDDHDVAGLLIEQPNADMTGLEFREALTTNLAARGNAYSIVTRKPNGEARTLDPVPWARVAPRRREDNGAIEYRVEDRGKVETYPQERSWHWKGFGYSGLVGLSPIGCARQALGLALAGEEAGGRLFSNGLAASAVIKIPQWLTDVQREVANKKLAEMHSGLAKYGKPYLLEGGMDLAEGVFAPRDAQFLELRKMQVPEICRTFRISPHMVADLERATNNNIEQLSLEFMMYTMTPYFRRIEELAVQLFKPSDRRKYAVKFNNESLLRADSAARASLYSILLQNGVFSRNEVRALENRNRSEADGMDDYTVQSNMALLQMIEAMNKGANK